MAALEPSPTRIDLIEALSQWWTIHCKGFSQYFLKMSPDQRRGVLLQVSDATQHCCGL